MHDVKSISLPNLDCQGQTKLCAHKLANLYLTCNRKKEGYLFFFFEETKDVFFSFFLVVIFTFIEKRELYTCNIPSLYVLYFLNIFNL